jgi:Predicted membrane-bound dolichyl-phosphate-mannose-protein mannosyltransferase
LIIAILVLTSTYILVDTAWSLHQTEIERGGRGYVTDEVWYVSAARNIMIKILGLQPRQTDTYGVTIVFTSKPINYFPLIKLADELNLSLRTDYTKLPAIYVNGSRTNVEEFVNITKSRYNVSDVVPGWQLPDNEGVNDYINWEHPPMGKYLIALSILIAGDSPICWRIPIIVFGVASTVLVFLILEQLSGSVLLGLAGSMIFILDTMSRAIFSIAILDGYVAFFTVLGLYLVIRGRYREALIASTVAGLFKATGIFVAIPVIILLARNHTKLKNGNLLDFIYQVIVYGLITITLYTGLLTIASAPIIYHMGYLNWLKYSLLGSIGWHLSAKCTTPGCPTSSAPWDWFIGHNSFTLYIYPDGKTLSAEGFYPLWFTSIVLALVFIPLVYRGYRVLGYNLLFYFGVLSGYIIIWILGSRTQYSFYAVQLAPLVYINLFYILYLSTVNTSIQFEVIRTWKTIVSRVKELIEELILINTKS